MPARVLCVTRSVALVVLEVTRLDIFEDKFGHAVLTVGLT